MFKRILIVIFTFFIALSGFLTGFFSVGCMSVYASVNDDSIYVPLRSENDAVPSESISTGPWSKSRFSAILAILAASSMLTLSSSSDVEGISPAEAKRGSTTKRKPSSMITLASLKRPTELPPVTGSVSPESLS